MSPDSAQGAKKTAAKRTKCRKRGLFWILPRFHRQLSASTASCSQQPVVKCSSRKPHTTCRISTWSECCWKQYWHFLCALRWGLEKGQKVTGFAVCDTAWPHQLPMAGECRSSSVWDLGTALYLEQVQSAFLEVHKKTSRCGTSPHGLVGTMLFGQMLNMVILKNFSSLWF